MLPSAEELAYFLEICSVLNLSRAAKKIGISQPSLSLALKRLENTIGTTLFIRHKQGVTLTHAGKQLSLHARQLLQAWTNTKSKVLASEAEIQGYFTLGCHSTIGIHMVTVFLAEIFATHPTLEIHIKNDISRKITEQVINLSLDLGIVANPLQHPDLIIKKLCHDEVTFWVANDHHPNQAIHSAASVILCEPHLTQTQTLLSKAKKAGILSQRIITMDSLELVASLTAHGCGIGILPSRVANSLYPKKLKRIAKAPIYADELCLIYRGENRSVKAIQAIVNQITKSFSVDKARSE